MLHLAAALLPRAEEAPGTVELVKRGQGGVGPVIFLLILNIAIFIPFLLFFFYTLAQIVPSLAVVEDTEASSYARVPLSDIYADPGSTAPSTLDSTSAHISVDLGLREMLKRLSSLRTRFQVLALFRGLGVFFVLSLFESLIAGPSIYWLPSVLSILPQIALPLLLVQLYTLWTHIILTYPSSKTLFQRIPPFRSTFRATGPTLALFLAAKALTRFAIQTIRDHSPAGRRGALYPPFIAQLVLGGVGLSLVTVVPAHLVLTRIQASLLAADEKTIVTIDPVLRDGKGGEGDAVGMRDAFTSFGWRAWMKLGLLYAKVLFVVLVGGGAVLVADYITFMLAALIPMAG